MYVILQASSFVRQNHVKSSRLKASCLFSNSLKSVSEVVLESCDRLLIYHMFITCGGKYYNLFLYSFRCEKDGKRIRLDALRTSKISDLVKDGKLKIWCGP